MKRIFAIAFLVALVASSSDAGVLKNGRLFYVRASIGYGSQSLADINDSIEGDEQVFQSAGIPVAFETFGGAFDIGGELGFRLSKSVSLGIGVNYQTNSVNNSYEDFTGTYEDDVTLTILDFSGNICFWVPGGIFIGGSAGFGTGTMEEFTSFQIFGDPLSSFTISGDGDGDGFTAGAFAGYQAVFDSGLLVFGKVGYAYRNLKEFDGTFTSPEFGTSSGPIVNDAGRPIDFDFSGAYVVVGLGFSLGKTI